MSRLLLTLGAVAALASCAAPVRTASMTDAAARDTAEIEALGREFITRFNACRLNELVAMFHVQARFVSAGSPVPITQPAGIRQYLARPCGLEPPAEAALRELAAFREGPLAYLTGSFLLAQPPQVRGALHAPMNFTIVLRHEDGRWLVTAYHVSPGA